ncbi:LacI family DNA-binding transcriptional regulator [Streptomyces sp. TRM 70361]|uniref:LacI family DNA-binding transcriptional regulator n=1 Tax=Streptomyces sp. TRM 70361 TaxID=3116553 RepID=UPI002E7B63B0|nr:LacI family DNA-binding transcriptional regulator [Streptomyces sp. TRM 70361]MEE1938998.1 LacI family DNA-binding transcriptional regulator [Streptomyces sp. TRM 70361]
MGVSLKDVAARAGVSVKTVSNVVNGSAPVSPHTREKVRRALAELGYRPNLSARSLRRGRTGVIALALPGLDDPYFAELARLVTEAAAEHGWTVLIDQTGGRAERERQVLRGTGAQLADGLLLCPVTVGRRELADRTDATPLVLLGERVPGGTVPQVAVDDRRAAHEATGHLLSLGHTRVGVIGARGARGPGAARRRLAGHRQALRDAGLPRDARLVPPTGAYRRAEGAALLLRLLELDEPPRAVLCFDDLLALGALRAALSAGLRVPRDLALAGFGDIEDGRYSTPTLTTVSPDKAALARSAVALLAARIDGASGAPGGSGRPGAPTVVAGHRLLVRESTAGVAAAAGPGPAVPTQSSGSSTGAISS